MRSPLHHFSGNFYVNPRLSIRHYERSRKSCAGFGAAPAILFEPAYDCTKQLSPLALSPDGGRHLFFYKGCSFVFYTLTAANRDMWRVTLGVVLCGWKETLLYAKTYQFCKIHTSVFPPITVPLAFSNTQHKCHANDWKDVLTFEMVVRWLNHKVLFEFVNRICKPCKKTIKKELCITKHR